MNFKKDFRKKSIEKANRAFRKVITKQNKIIKMLKNSRKEEKLNLEKEIRINTQSKNKK